MTGKSLIPIRQIDGLSEELQARPIDLAVVVNIDYTILTSDTIILCDATNISFQVFLPSAIDANGPYSIKKIDNSANTVTIVANSGETIEGVPEIILLLNGTSITMVSNGVNWYII